MKCFSFAFPHKNDKQNFKNYIKLGKKKKKKKKKVKPSVSHAILSPEVLSV